MEYKIIIQIIDPESNGIITSGELTSTQQENLKTQFNTSAIELMYDKLIGSIKKYEESN